MNPEPLNLNKEKLLKEWDKLKYWVSVEYPPVVDPEEMAEYVINKIKSACEFYLKYFDKPYKLKKDYPKIADEVDEIIRETIEMTPEEDGWSHYNKWLFELTFKDVLDEGDKQ